MKRAVIISVIALCVTSIIIYTVNRYFKSKTPENELTLYGNVDVRQVDISFRVSGQVDHLEFEEGDVVREGDLMCTMEKSPYDSLLEESFANAVAIKAELDNAKILYERRLELIEIGAVSKEDLDNARSNYDKLRANLIQAEESINVANDNLSYTRAYAPTDGIILTRIREPGTVVNPAEPVYTLSVSSPIWVRAFVDEPNLGRVHYGMKATIYTDIKGGRPFEGKIGFISPVAEFTPKTVETAKLRTDLVYRLRIYVDNPEHELVQGMPVTIKLNLDQGSH